MWIHWAKGTRVGEWTSTDFSSRDEAIAWAKTRGGETIVREVPVHSTMPAERVTVRADGSIHSEHVTVCG